MTQKSNCPACDRLLKEHKLKTLKKCGICGHYRLSTEKHCSLDHELLKNGIRRK